MKTLKAGKYYIGDCCYVLQDDYDWSKGNDSFCNQFWSDGENIIIEDYNIVAYGTAYGDGEYPSNVNFSFPVDAGLIGICPAAMWKGEGEPFGCLLVEFKEDFECSELGGGKMQFGHVWIDTYPSYEENEGYDDDTQGIYGDCDESEFV